MSWFAIESDPGVLTEVIQQMKVKGVRVEELFSLSRECLNDLLPIYGLIFLCNMRLPQNDNRPVLDPHHCSANLFFAKQHVNNGFATQAIISILMNCPQLDIGHPLSNLKELSRNFPPALKSLSIANDEAIRNAHNSFAKPGPSVPDSTCEDGVFTFIDYVPVDNNIYELDGLKEGPIYLGDFNGGLDWLDVVIPIIQERVDKYSHADIEFTVLAVIKDRKEEYNTRLRDLQSRKEQILKELRERPDAGGNEAFIESLQRILGETNSELDLVKHNISMENEKIIKWRKEIKVRKHDYDPFYFNFLKIVSEKEELNDLIEKARALQEE
ncbi:hypothetical protein KI387_039432 [Taxus chinensis]|uniref:Ubiquitin carboxyl-terminal hydrolase n=1 Tax=Taxus chinensis TaxID=29808 RepID=A0AA38CFT3_TAXCH|nr:hypothetical protein KI387_039432 [Taxus chinensis]